MTTPSLVENMTLEMVVGDAIGVVWDKFGVGELFRAQEKSAGGRWTADFLRSQAESDKMQLWLVLEDRQNIMAALVTDTNPYANGLKTCMVVVVVGSNPRSWIPLRHVLEDWAKRSGCAWIEAIGRVGWKRIMPDWTPSAVFFEKALL
jgi:hypothetical protein